VRPPLPKRPGVPRTRRRWRAFASAALGLALAVTGVAWAFEVHLSGPRVRGSYVIVEARLVDLFDDHVRSSLERGMPATLELHTELWRRRGLWFDKLEQSFDASVRVQYDVWDGVFDVQRPGAPVEEIATVDSVGLFLTRAWGVPIARPGGLRFGTQYYGVVTATLRPVSAEDVSEVEGWLAGRGRLGGLGVLTELPRTVFDAVRNVAGFGDRRARGITDPFIPDTLSAAER
jgi:hypothetical protein